ncbi:MAG: hypothetical protein ACRD3J_30410, partial [Thermoanaerobaculia bacterium]
STVVLYASLLALAGLPIDPVRWRYASDAAPAIERYHGQPFFSITGTAVWLLALAVYVLAAALPFAQYGRIRFKPALIALCLSAMTTAFAHPLLIPVVLPRPWRTAYVQLLERIHCPVGAGRIGFNVVALLTSVSLLQAMLVCLVMWGAAESPRHRSRL